MTDPASGAAYTYRVLDGDIAYELCAAFERDSAAAGGPFSDAFWSHQAGRQCFRRAAPKPR